MTTDNDLSRYGEVEGDQRAVSEPAAPLSVEEKLAKMEQDYGTLKQQVNTQTQQQPVLNQLLADPNIRGYIEAKQRGENVQLSPVAPPPEEKEETVNWEELTPAQQSQKQLELMDKRFAKMLDKRLQPVQQTTQAVQSHIAQQQQQAAVQAVATVRAKYPDFDKHISKIQELNQQFQGTVDPESLYLLARARNGQAAPADERRMTETERPTHSAARPPMRAATPREASGPASGNARFQSALEHALDRVPVPQFMG